MSHAWDPNSLAWKDALLTIGAGALLLVAAAIAAARCCQAARARRAIWQAAVLGIGLLLVLEVTGLSGAAVAWWRLAAQNPVPRIAASGQTLNPAAATIAEPTKNLQPEIVAPRREVAEQEDKLAFAVQMPLPTTVEGGALPSNEAGETPPQRLPAMPGNPATGAETGYVATTHEAAKQDRVAWTGDIPVWAVLVRLYWTIAAGLLLHLAWGYLRLLRFRQRLRWLESGAEQARFQAVVRRIGLRRQIHLATSNEVASPLAMGIFNPVVVIPADFGRRFTEPEQQVMLAHEVAHHAGFDLAWRTLADWLGRLLWFHPAVWYARSQFTAAVEQAADEASLLVDDGPGVLAECLVILGRQLQRQRNLGWLGIAAGEFRSTLGQRVQRLLALDGDSYATPRKFGRFVLIYLGSTMVVGAAIFCTMGARSHTSFPLGDSHMSVLQRYWRHSLAGLALVTLGGAAAISDDAPDSPPKPAAAASADDQGERPKAEQPRRDGDQPREGTRRDGDRPRPEGARDGDRPRPEGARDGDRPQPEGARDGDRPRPEGARDGDRPRPEGARDGDRPRPEGARDGDRPRPEGARDGDRPRPEGAREGDRPRPEGPPREGGPRPDGPPRPEGPQGEAQRKVFHLMQAAANLDAAGLRDQAAEIRAQAERLRREAGMMEGGPRDGRPGPGGPPREGERPRFEGPREGERPGPGGPPREGERPRFEGPREGGPPADMIRLIQEMREQIQLLRREVEMLRAKSEPR